MQTVRVRLRRPTRVFTFLCRDIDIQPDDACIVRSDRGMEYGTCVAPPESCPEEIQKRLTMQVVRKATYNDKSCQRQIEQEEAKAKEVCRRHIAKRNLPMKLVDAEYTFDRHKIIFYFTAAERVDFRQLVRDLAQELRARIELRHIQVRDEAKLVGGVGVCGRELCCSSWLGQFKPISMKMAKRQNLSLNPSKISGQCGRLLCCLSYEYSQYPDRKAQAPEGMAKWAEELEEEGAELVEDDWEQERLSPSFRDSVELGTALPTEELLPEQAGEAPLDIGAEAAGPRPGAPAAEEDVPAFVDFSAQGPEKVPVSLDAPATESSRPPEQEKPRGKRRKRRRRRKDRHQPHPGREPGSAGS